MRHRLSSRLGLKPRVNVAGQFELLHDYSGLHATAKTRIGRTLRAKHIFDGLILFRLAVNVQEQSSLASSERTPTTLNRTSTRGMGRTFEHVA